MTVANRQAALARFLTDPALERRVREDPEAAAIELDVDLQTTRRLAAISTARVQAFRSSSQVKARRRAGP